MNNPTTDRCCRCGGAIELVTELPPPYWRHLDARDLATPHAAEQVEARRPVGDEPTVELGRLIEPYEQHGTPRDGAS